MNILFSIEKQDYICLSLTFVYNSLSVIFRALLKVDQKTCSNMNMCLFNKKYNNINTTSTPSE